MDTPEFLLFPKWRRPLISASPLLPRRHKISSQYT